MHPISVKVKRQCALVLVVCFLVCLIPSTTKAETEPSQVEQRVIKVTYTPRMNGGKVLGQPLVTARLNKTAEVNFLVDTGSSVSIISDKIAKELGLRLEPAISDDGKPFDLFKKNMLMGRVSTLEMGNFAGVEITFSNAALLIVDDKTLNFGSLSRNVGSLTHIDGIVGANLLEHFPLLLNAQDHTLLFVYPGNLSPDRLKSLGMTSPYVLPMLRDLLPAAWYSTIKFSNQESTAEESLKIDTGSGTTIISGQTAKQLKLKSVEQYKIIDYSGEKILDIANVASASVGNLSLSNLAVEYQSDPKISSVPVLGMDVLSGYKVLIDFPAKKMYLQPNTPSVNITVKPQTLGAAVGK